MTAPLLALVGLALLAHVLLQHSRFRDALRARSTPPRLVGGYPSITVIRPVRGKDVGAQENFVAALDTGYPGEVETVFVVDDETDPAHPLLERVVAAHRAAGAPGKARLLVAGPPPAGRTGKLNAMMAGMRVARGELVAFGDSDSRPDRDVLRVLVETLLSIPRAGCAFAPVVVPDPARTAGDLGYALMLNGLYTPTVALATVPTGDLPFIMGQLMVFRREALEAAGGLQCADGHLVDDMQIGSCLSAAGWRNVPASHPLRLVTGGMDLVSFLALMRRWLSFQRGGLPFSFTAPQFVRGLEFGFGLAAGVGLAAARHLLAAVPALALMIAVGWSVATLHVAHGGAPIAPRHLWVPLMLYLAGPLALVSSVVLPAVRWRGREYALDAHARLDLPSAASGPRGPGQADDSFARSRS